MSMFANHCCRKIFLLCVLLFHSPIVQSQTDGQDDGSNVDTVSYKPSIAGTGTIQARDMQQNVCRNIAASYYSLPPGGDITSMPNYKELSPFYNDTIESFNSGGFGPIGGSGLSTEVGAVFKAGLKFPQEGAWKLCILSDNGSNLFINDKLIASVIYAPKKVCTNYTTKTNQINNVRIEFFQERGPHELYLYWSLINSNYSTEVIVPPCAFLKPSTRVCYLFGFIKIRCCGLMGRILHKCKK